MAVVHHLFSNELFNDLFRHNLILTKGLVTDDEEKLSDYKSCLQEQLAKRVVEEFNERKRILDEIQLLLLEDFPTHQQNKRLNFLLHRLGFELNEDKTKVFERDQDPPVKRYLGPPEPKLNIWERMVIAEDERVEIQKRDLKLLNDWLRELRSRHVRVYKYTKSSEARLEELKRRRQERREKYISDLAKGRRYLITAFHEDNDRMLRESHEKKSKQLAKARTTERKTPRVSVLGLSSNKIRKLITEGKQIEKATYDRNLQKEQSSSLLKRKKIEKTFPQRQTKKDAKEAHMAEDEFKKGKQVDSVKDIKSKRKTTSPTFRKNEERRFIGKKHYDEKSRTNGIKGKSKNTAELEKVLKAKSPEKRVPDSVDIQRSVSIKQDSHIMKTSKPDKPSPGKKKLVHRPVERKYDSGVEKAKGTTEQKRTNLGDKRVVDINVRSSSKGKPEEKKLIDKVQEETGEKFVASKLEKQPSSKMYKKSFAIPSSIQEAQPKLDELSELSEHTTDYPKVVDEAPPTYERDKDLTCKDSTDSFGFTVGKIPAGENETSDGTAHESDEESIENCSYPEEPFIEENVSGSGEDNQTVDEVSEHEVTEGVSEHESDIDLNESKITEDTSESEVAEDLSEHKITQNIINNCGTEDISEHEAADNISEEEKIIEDVRGSEVPESISEDYKNTEENMIMKPISEPGDTDESIDKKRTSESLAKENVEEKQNLFKERESEEKDPCMADEIVDKNQAAILPEEISEEVTDYSYDEKATKGMKVSIDKSDDQTIKTEEKPGNAKSEDSRKREEISSREKRSNEYEDHIPSEESKTQFSEAAERRDSSDTEQPLITETAAQEYRTEQTACAEEPTQSFRSERHNIEDDYGTDKIYLDSYNGEQLTNACQTSKAVKTELASKELPTERQVPNEDDQKSSVDLNGVIEFITKEDLSTVEFSTASDEAPDEDRDDQSIDSKYSYDSNENENYIDRHEDASVKSDNEIKQTAVFPQASSDYRDVEETPVAGRTSPEILCKPDQEENAFVQQKTEDELSEDEEQ